MVMDGRSRRPLQRALMGGVPSIALKTTEYVYGRSDDPNTTYGYPNTCYLSALRGANHTRGAMKFEKMGAATYDMLIFANSMGADQKFFGLLSNMALHLQVYAITEDFDPSIATYTTLGALARTPILPFPFSRATTAAQVAWIRIQRGGQWAITDVALSGVYGLYLIPPGVGLGVGPGSYSHQNFTLGDGFKRTFAIK